MSELTLAHFDILPFNGSWLTFWGGDTLELNHHHKVTSQCYAFDFIVTDDGGNFFGGDGSTCEDYFGFGKDILTPAEGVVVEAVDGLRDNKPGQLNNFNFIGNYVMLEHEGNVFSILGHLRNGSVMVKPNQKVNAGSKLGECGNSGHSTDPHLHFHAQNSPVFAEVDKDYKTIDVAKGIKAVFRAVEVGAGKDKVLRKSYSPVKGDIVSNENE